MAVGERVRLRVRPLWIRLTSQKRLIETDYIFGTRPAVRGGKVAREILVSTEWRQIAWNWVYPELLRGLALATSRGGAKASSAATAVALDWRIH